MNQKHIRKLTDPLNSYLEIVPFHTPISCPFQRLIDEWLIACRAAGRSDKTREDYYKVVSKFLWWWKEYTHYYEKLGTHPKFVTRKEAREFVVYLREPNPLRWGQAKDSPTNRKTTLSAASISSYGRTIRVFFNWLATEDYIEISPFSRGVSFDTKKSDRVIKTVSQEGIVKIFSCLLDPERKATWVGRRDLAIIAFFYDTGIRKGELISMKISDISLENRRAVVRGKTGEREVPLGEECRAALASYLQHPQTISNADVPLWQTVDGSPLTSQGVYSMVRRISAASGVKFHPHQLRHTFATQMASTGITLFDLMDLMGHSDVSTSRIYVSRNFERLAELKRLHSPLSDLTSKTGMGIRKRGRPFNKS